MHVRVHVFEGLVKWHNFERLVGFRQVGNEGGLVGVIVPVRTCFVAAAIVFVDRDIFGLTLVELEHEGHRLVLVLDVRQCEVQLDF